MKLKIILALCLLFLLFGCVGSRVQYDDKKEYCASKGMEFDDGSSDYGFLCYISDIDYTKEMTIKSEPIKSVTCISGEVSNGST